MKRRAFTLIELLAVIVIIAVIALITIPIILHIIENVQKNAVKESVNFYIHAITQNIAIDATNGEGGKFENTVCLLSKDTMNCVNNESFPLKMQGDKLDELRVELDAEEHVQKATFRKNKYCGNYISDKGITFTSCEDVNKIDASSVQFTPSDASWNVENVEDALNDLYR